MDRQALMMYSVLMFVALCIGSTMCQMTMSMPLNHGDTTDGEMADHNMTDGMDHGNMTDHNMTHGMDHGNETDHDPDHDGGHDPGTGHGGGHNQNMGHGSNTGHGVYFRLGNEVQLIFEEWSTDSDKSIGLAVLYVILAAMAFEGLKAFRDYISASEAKQRKQQREWSYSTNDKKADSTCSCCIAVLHVLQVLLHTVQVFISMCLMMVFMTLNVWLCLAVCCGAGLGYLVFGKCRYSPAADMEYCH